MALIGHDPSLFSAWVLFCFLAVLALLLDLLAMPSLYHVNMANISIGIGGT